MNILDLLKSDDHMARVVHDDRWLVCDGDDFVVYGKRYGKAVGIELIRTPSEKRAVEVLTHGA